jgi:hypothetical protein
MGSNYEAFHRAFNSVHLLFPPAWVAMTLSARLSPNTLTHVPAEEHV